MTNFVEVAVIGAGAAGLAAGVRLAAAGVNALVLEARQRIGGRAWTVDAGGFPVDLGCGWLHSANENPLAKAAQAAGFTIDKAAPHWTRQALNADFSPAQQAQFRRAFGEMEDVLHKAAQTGVDRPAAECFDPHAPWTPLLNAFSAFYNGAEFDQVSVIDFAAFEDSGVNWRVTEGYGAAIALLGATAPVRLGVQVEVIDHSAPGVITLRTSQGALEAKVVIVTAPTSVIAREQLRFAPALPAKTAAAEGLPLGLADKVVLGLERPEDLPVEGHLFGDIHRTDTGTYQLRPFGRPLIEGFFGGGHAWSMESEGEGALTAFALEELVKLLGSEMRTRLTPLAASRWGGDPFAGGGYSHALPGRAGDRAILAEPVDHRLFFAGEACSPNFYSTAHGAWITGEAAADAALEALRLRSGR